ncbi:MAG TPA: hypothetical protein VLG38_03630 [Gammaproteobacteria bacterium]|nr:hypothetical protein [Gammaproteobacteria bacterium]
MNPIGKFARADKAFLAASTLLALCYILSLLILWPGVMSPDASSQYAMAMSGVYTDHHPPLMSFVWRYLAQIYPGPAPMFILHISMLYLATAIFLYMFRESRFKWWYAVYPLLPNLVAYTALIVKDTGFTYTYLLSGAIMSYMVVTRTQKYKLPLLAAIILLLFYGTAVKFQAKYILIFFTLGVSYCWANYKFNLKSVSGGIVLYMILMAAITATNGKLVPIGKGSNSWQWVKVYDLSAISIELDRPLYPDYILQQENFDFGKVKQLFRPSEVDPLVFETDAVIRRGKDELQHQQLWDYWFATIKQHPILYLQARARLFSYNLTTSPCERNNPVKFLRQTSLAAVLDIPGVGATLDAGYTIFKIAFRFMWILPLVFLYLYLGIKNFRTSPAAAPLLLFCSSSLSLLVVLFFCSMAGTARYVFLSSCLMHASHGMAFMVWRHKALSATPRIAKPPHLSIVNS